MQHNTWTRTKPTITESCLLITKDEYDYYLYELIFDEPDVIPLQDGSEWGLWQDLTAQQYLTLKLPV